MIYHGFIMNSVESGLHHDYEAWLEELAPHEPTEKYWHDHTGEDNADAHLKRIVFLIYKIHG